MDWLPSTSQVINIYDEEEEIVTSAGADWILSLVINYTNQSLSSAHLFSFRQIKYVFFGKAIQE